MCKMNVVVNRLMLGNRELGWEVWNGRCIEEFTSRQLIDMITGGRDKVYGLRIGKDGELEADSEGFFTTSIMEHRHIGNYRPMDSDSLVNMSYSCFGIDKANGKTVYKCISNKFEQVSLSDEQIKAYLTLGVLTGGARLKDGKVEVAKVETAIKKPADNKPVEREKEVKKPTQKGKESVTAVASRKEEMVTVTPMAKENNNGKEGK